MNGKKRLWEPFLFSLPPTARNREKRLLPLLPSRPEIRSVKPASARQESVSRRSVPSRGLPPRVDRDGRFRIGS